MKLYLTFALLLLISCSSGQVTSWQDEVFESTPIGQNTKHTFVIGEINASKEMHISEIDFDKSSNAQGHFRLEKVMVGNKLSDKKDIVIPPGSALTLTISYSPLDLNTSKASYANWRTGESGPWFPKHPDEVKEELQKDENHGPKAIHRSLIYVMYTLGRKGMHTIQLVGSATPGLNGELSVPRAGGPCNAGGGTGCYAGDFLVDIPKLAPGGPKPMELTGPVRFAISGSDVELKMDEFPPAIMYLRASDIPQLPSGVVATLIVSGGEGSTAKGTFDGARLLLSKVSFRVRVAMGELTKENLIAGVAAMVDFNVPDLEIKTTDPLNQGKIKMEMETTLPENPSGNEIFDQFLSGAKIVLIMKGEFKY